MIPMFALATAVNAPAWIFALGVPNNDPAQFDTTVELKQDEAGVNPAGCGAEVLVAIVAVLGGRVGLSGSGVFARASWCNSSVFLANWASGVS